MDLIYDVIYILFDTYSTVTTVVIIIIAFASRTYTIRYRRTHNGKNPIIYWVMLALYIGLLALVLVLALWG